MFVGCASDGMACGKFRKSIETRCSFVLWNIDSALGKKSSQNALAVVELASRSPEELRMLIESCPAPNPQELHGQWIGINKGFGPALVGLTQDVKQFKPIRSQCADGNNLMVEQVPICDLRSHGWQPKLSILTKEKQELGNFAVSQTCGDLELDYSKAQNRWFDPARYLVDELVQVDDGLLLGRANLQFGCVRIPLAYFTLSRRPCNECDECTE